MELVTGLRQFLKMHVETVCIKFAHQNTIATTGIQISFTLNCNSWLLVSCKSTHWLYLTHPSKEFYNLHLIHPFPHTLFCVFLEHSIGTEHYCWSGSVNETLTSGWVELITPPALQLHNIFHTLGVCMFFVFRTLTGLSNYNWAHTNTDTAPPPHSPR